MTEQGNTLEIKILGKSYIVKCQPDEVSALEKAAAYLDAQMQEVRNSGKVIGSDRIAVITALNITHALLTQKSLANTQIASMHERIKSIQDKVETAIVETAEA